MLVIKMGQENVWLNGENLIIISVWRRKSTPNLLTIRHKETAPDSRFASFFARACVCLYIFRFQSPYWSIYIIQSTCFFFSNCTWIIKTNMWTHTLAQRLYLIEYTTSNSTQVSSLSFAHIFFPTRYLYINTQLTRTFFYFLSLWWNKFSHQKWNSYFLDLCVCVFFLMVDNHFLSLDSHSIIIKTGTTVWIWKLW